MRGLTLLSSVATAFLLAPGVPHIAAHASEDEAVQPYLERLKRANNIQTPTAADGAVSTDDPGKVQPHMEMLKKSADANFAEPGPSRTGDNVQPYMDRLAQDPEARVSDPPQLKRPPKDPEAVSAQPYLEAVKQGHELQPKMRAPVHQALGFAFGANTSLNIDAGKNQANSFESVYNSEKKYNPTIEISYEYHLLRSRTWGALGPLLKAGLIISRGTGRFTQRNEETDIKFTMTALPLTGGFIYRANQLRFFVPYLQAGLVGIPFIESRKDNKPSRKALAYSYTYTYGAAINLDWISRKSAWSRYDEQGILHTYIFVQRQHARKLAGNIDFRTDMTMAGLAFEF